MKVRERTHALIRYIISREGPNFNFQLLTIDAESRGQTGQTPLWMILLVLGVTITVVILNHILGVPPV